MKIQLMSDLHFGHKHKHLPKLSKEADVLVVAGDTSSLLKKCHEGFEKILNGASIPVIFVLGNHDYYDNIFVSAPDDFKKFFSKKPNYYFLEKDKIYLGGVSFVGTTMWTDLDKGNGEVYAQLHMPDYHYILKSKNGRFVLIDTKDTIDEYNKSVSYLNNIVQKGDIIITHHMPSWKFVSQQFLGNSLTSAFVTEMDQFILDKEPALWLFGHTHIHCDGYIGNTRCVCNPFGYPFEGYREYKEEFIIEV